MLDFVDECTGLNAEDDSVRRRSVLLFRKLLGEESLQYDDPTMQVFFDFFVKRLSDFNVTEEVLRTLLAISSHHPAVGEVCLCSVRLSVAGSTGTPYIPLDKYQSGHIQVFLPQACVCLDSSPPPVAVALREPGRYGEGGRERNLDSSLRL